MIRRLLTILAIMTIAFATAQNEDRIEAQKREVERLEKRVAEQDRELSKIKKGRVASDEVVRSIATQLSNRNKLLNATERQARLLRNELSRANNQAEKLSVELTHHRTQYAEMVREAYRNYKHENYLTYIFASRNFTDIARKISNLRAVATLRESKMEQIKSLSKQIATQQAVLTTRKGSLDSVTRNLATQKKRLQSDVNSAKATAKQLSRREKEALQKKMAQEQQLEFAINELRKLTRGNTEGTSFSTKTSGLRLPVTGGAVKRYKDNMAEVVGPRGASVISIYDGKVVDIKRNRITDKYDVFVAHGDYITSYANLESIEVQKGQKIARNGILGTIGASMNIITMEPEYKMVFGIYPPASGREMRAESCFRK